MCGTVCAVCMVLFVGQTSGEDTWKFAGLRGVGASTLMGSARSGFTQKLVDELKGGGRKEWRY